MKENESGKERFFINDAEAGELTLEEKKPSASEVLYEDTSRRGKNTKHFRLRNGNFMAVMYDRPVHDLDPMTGKYVDISSGVEETDTDYEAVMPSFKVRLPKTDGKDRFVTVEKSNREVSWRLVPRSASRRKRSMALFSGKEKSEPWDMDGRPSVKYEKADANTDLQYDISDSEVKEFIVLSKDPGCRTYTFQMKFKGLLPILSEDKKTVLLVRDDADPGAEMPEMQIPPAFMKDANEAFCDELHYEIRKAEDDIVFLDLVLDTDWLSDPERAYPVVIDPRVEISRHSGNNLKMVELCSDGSRFLSSNTNTGKRIGVDRSGNVHRLYIGVTLPTLADGFKITKAGLLLHQKACESYNGETEIYTIAPVVDPDGKKLSVDSFTWDNVQNLKTEAAIDTLQGYSRHAATEIDIDMTAVMEKWYDPEAPFVKERCIVIKKNNEEPCCCDSSRFPTYLNLYSMYAEEAYRPRMYIEYTSTDMYSDHQKFHTFENGRAGTGSVNLFTGKMSFVHGDVTAEGVRLPLSISHLYRQEYVNEEQNSVNRYGKGWRLSVEQTLEVVNAHGIMAVYTNAQGKRHYFMCNEDDENGKITDDAGLGLTYKKESNCICGLETTHVLTDEKGNRMTFNSSGKLIQLIDVNGNVSSLRYTNGRLSSVLDGTNHSAQLYYDNAGMLTKIVDNGDDTRAILYNYNTSGELISITYPSAETAYANEGTLKTRFVYGANSRLEQVIDYTGIKYTIGYDANGRVNLLSNGGNTLIADNHVTVSDEVWDDPISFEYRAKSTAIVNTRTGIRAVYRFDANGRELSSYQDMSGAKDSSKIGESTITEIMGYETIEDSSTVGNIGKYRSLSVSMNNDSADEINLLRNGCFTETYAASKLLPFCWKAVGGRGVVSQSYLAGKKSFRFSSSGRGQYLSQTVDLCKCRLDGNILVASAWAKAYGNVSAESENSGAKFRLCLKVVYESGEVEEYSENYDTGYEGWQYVAIPFVLKKDPCPINVTVKLDYTGNTGNCYFTNARLVSVNGTVTTNEYGTDEAPVNLLTVFGEQKKIKMTTTKSDNVTTTIAYFDDRSDIVRTEIVDRSLNRFRTDYKYDSKHNLVRMLDPRGLVVEYTYNKYGKELTRKTYFEETPNSYMFSEHSYQDGSFVKSESDPRYTLNGEKLNTLYQHDTSRNLLLKQTTVNGQEYNYSYDEKTDDLMSLSSATDHTTNENQFFYTRGYLTRVAHNGFHFGFSFDQLGRSKSVSVGDSSVTTTLLTSNYEKDGVNNITETVFATGEKNRVTTDIFGNPVVSTYTDKNNAEKVLSNAIYDSVGKVKKLVDNERGICYNYTYDSKGNVVKVVETDSASGAVLTTNTFVFDADERLTLRTYGAVGQTYRPVYEQSPHGYICPDNEVLGITLDGKFTDKVEKDGLRRVSGKTFRVGSNILFGDSYSYLSTPREGQSIETELVSSVTSRVYGVSAKSSALHYTYNKAGNPETVSDGASLLSRYFYDGLNRLKREDNHTVGKTYVWTYDAGGNILSKKEYALCTDVHLGTCLDTKVYTYKNEGWRDRLDSYDGQVCTYDPMGNPLTYRGNVLTWTKVRRLASFGENTFAYGASGIRYRKNNTVYTLDGNKILRESDGTRTLTYYHGGSGIVGFAYKGTDYYFRKNLQGDVTEIYTSAGLLAASYVYDAWGKILAIRNETAENIGDVNPIRYRSYYYDTETGLYYLNSRYYDPETGRFINADTTDILENAQYDINGLNLYAYCDNDPVTGRDDEGDWSFWKKLAVAVAVVVTVAVVTAVVCATAGIASPLCAAGTVFYCAAKGAAVGAVAGAVTGAATGALQGAVEGYQETGSLEGALEGMGKGALKGAVEGATDGMVSGMISGAFSGAFMSFSGNAMFCFVAGTPVLTTVGKKAIEAVQVGDTIPCVDHITGEAAEKKVVSTTVNKVDRLMELDIDGEVIRCTETHPFQVKGSGWVDASDLHPGDVLYTEGWGTATVRSVGLLVLDEPVEVFNFEVEDCHTYFVGEVGVLVHNSSCHQSKEWRAEKKRYWKEQAELYRGNVQNQRSLSGTYDVISKNWDRMLQGKVPKGIDNKWVNLHHTEGIKTNMCKYVEMTQKEHFSNFKVLHFWLFG